MFVHERYTIADGKGSKEIYRYQYMAILNLDTSNMTFVVVLALYTWEFLLDYFMTLAKLHHTCNLHMSQDRVTDCCYVSNEYESIWQHLTCTCVYMTLSPSLSLSLSLSFSLSLSLSLSLS